MAGQDEFRGLLEAGDVDALRHAWAWAAPHLPQPGTRDQAEIVMHHARTQTESLTFKARAYSHRWLTERDVPSGLPERLKPKAERLCPRVALAVGISVNMRSAWMRPAVAEIRGAMENAVLEIDADGRLEDAALVKSRMLEARESAFQALFGRFG